MSAKFKIKRGLSAAAKRKQLIAFVMLAMFTGYSFTLEREHSNSNRAAVAASTQQVLQAGCQRTNDLRIALVSVLEDSRKAQAAAAKAGRIPESAVKQSEVFLKTEEARIGPLPCDKLYKIK